jgi:hypothetical protein
MALKTFGKVVVTTAGTPERVTKNEATPAARVGAQSVFIQAWHANLGKVFIGVSGMNKGTGAGVIATLPIPTTNIHPSFSGAIVEAPAGLNLADLFLDVDTSGEAAIVSYSEQ